MSERSIGLRVATGLTVTVAALSAAACGSKSGPNYGKQTEARIQRVVTPVMTRIAKAAIRLERTSHGQVTAQVFGRNLVEIAGVSTSNAVSKNALDEIDVVMRTFPGTTRPNPAQTLVADVESSDNATQNGPFTNGGVEFVAPGQSNTTKKMQFTMTGLYSYDKQGWTAIQEVSFGKNGTVDQGASFDTADASEFVADDLGNPSDPITTAKSIASDVPTTLEAVVSDFEVR